MNKHITTPGELSSATIMPNGTTTNPFEAHFSAADYQAIAEQLSERLATTDFYSGTLAYERADISSRLVATLIIYRTPRSPAPPSGGEIYSVVPIWWEMHTFLPDGREVLNDFELRSLIPLLTTTPPPLL